MTLLINHLLLISLIALFPSSVFTWQSAQCYYGPNQKLQFDNTAESYQPCGETSDGPQSCCRAGHMCLKYGVCYGFDSGVTYTAGCTDLDYTDSSCPQKCDYKDLYWIGHNICNATDSPPAWNCCLANFGNESNGLTKPDASSKKPCDCDNNPSVAFHAPDPIPSIGILAYTNGISLSYFAGMGPTGTQTTDSSASSTATSTKPAASATGAPTTMKASATNPITTSSPAAALPSSSLPTGSIVGISIGSGLGSIMLLGLLAFWFIRRRRARKPDLRPLDIDSITIPKTHSFSFGGTLRKSRGNPQSTTPAVSEVASPTFSGHKSELPGDEPRSPATFTAPNEERPNTATTSTLGSQGLAIGAAASTYPQHQHQNQQQYPNHNPGPYFPQHHTPGASPGPGPGPGPGSIFSEGTNNTYSHTDPTIASISRAGSAATANSAEAAQALTNANGTAIGYGRPPSPAVQPGAGRVYQPYQPYHPGMVGTSQTSQARLEEIHEMPG